MELSINREPYIFQEGKVYSIINNISHVQEQIIKDNNTVLAVEDYSKFNMELFLKKRRKVKDVLKNSGFSEIETLEIVSNCGVNIDSDTYNLSADKRAFLLINILLHNVSPIFFEIAGYTFLTAQSIYQLLFDRVKNTNKIAIILEPSTKNEFKIEQVTQDIIDNYREWIDPYKYQINSEELKKYLGFYD